MYLGPNKLDEFLFEGSLLAQDDAMRHDVVEQSPDRPNP